MAKIYEFSTWIKKLILIYDMPFGKSKKKLYKGCKNKIINL